MNITSTENSTDSLSKQISARALELRGFEIHGSRNSDSKPIRNPLDQRCDRTALRSYRSRSSNQRKYYYLRVCNHLRRKLARHLSNTLDNGRYRACSPRIESDSRTPIRTDNILIDVSCKLTFVRLLVTIRQSWKKKNDVSTGQF